LANPDKTEEPGISSKKRVLRAPTTVRGQAEQATEKQKVATAKGPNTFWSGFFYPLRLVARGLRRVGRLWPIRIIGKVLGLILFASYFRGSFRELRLVTWPGRRESLRLTSAVLVFAIVFGAIVAGVDFGLDKLFKELVLK
jgi:preprotein translocase SecE subunit